jgi:hypothetical protein
MALEIETSIEESVADVSNHKISGDKRSELKLGQYRKMSRDA